MLGISIFFCVAAMTGVVNSRETNSVTYINTTPTELQTDIVSLQTNTLVFKLIRKCL